MGRSLGVACTKEEILLAVVEDGELVDDPHHEKLTAPALLEQTERLEGMLTDLDRMIREVAPDIVRLLLPEHHRDSYARISPRVTLETLVRLACVKAKVPIELLHRASARARLSLPSSGNFEAHLKTTLEPVGRYWNSGRSLAAAAALAEET